MPTIEISKTDLENLCRKKFKIEDLQELLENQKISLENFNKDTLTLKIEDTNRADLLSVEGISRQLKGILKKEIGIPIYKIETAKTEEFQGAKNKKFLSKSSFIVKVDLKVSKVRPFTACCVVKNLDFNDYFVEQIIQLQEKLTDTFGKKRKEAAIGIYDFDKIKWPITYTTFKPESLSFQPLGMSEILNLKQIIEKHEKGKEFGHLLKNLKEYPVFIDADEKVLSMPPIINSEYSGKVTKETKNVFIEVSGFDFEKVSFILNIIASALAERRGTIYSVDLKGLNKTTPEFKSKTKKIRIENINSLLGTKLTAREINELLFKQRFYSKQDQKDKNSLIVEIPFFRKDIIHENDIIEDIAIAYGYKNLQPIEPRIYTTGSILEETSIRNNIAEKLIGLGFQEILSFVLTNEKEQFENMFLSEDKNLIKIKNPVSETFTCLRSSLLPSLMKFFSNNLDKDFPQKIFELGKIVLYDSKKETKTREENHLSIAISHSKANFTEILESLNYLLNKNLVSDNFKEHKIQNINQNTKNTNLQHTSDSTKESKIELKPKDNPSFIPGRCAEVYLNKKLIGIIGEIHPKTLSKWKLRMPVVALEINLEN